MGTFALAPLPKINKLFALLKQQSTLQHLTSTVVTTTSSWMKKSIPKSAFTTVFGKFKFLRLPFGLSQGPDFFIHLIYDLFGLDKTSNQGQGSRYLTYLDNLLIQSKPEKEH